jgi:hypothetical protein
VRMGNPAGRLDTQDIWLQGIPTKNYSDGKKFTLEQCMEVTATKRYTTVLGATSTVVVVAPFDVKPHLKPIAPPKPKPAGKPREKIEDQLNAEPKPKPAR